MPEKAIGELCRQTAYNYASIQKMHSIGLQTEVNNVMIYEFDLVVKNIFVISRFFSIKDNTCTVWVACGKNDISQGENLK
jgi:hypothetical protein